MRVQELFEQDTVVDLRGKKVDGLTVPWDMEGNKVWKGDFKYSPKAGSQKLTSLNGSPERIMGSFDVSHNRLVDLRGSPKEVDTSFFCNHNQLTSLEGAPKLIGHSFSCSNNKIESLHDVHRHLHTVRDSMWFSYNPIKECLLGLLLLDQLRTIGSAVNFRNYPFASQAGLDRACDIVNKYLPNTLGRSVLIACQNEMLDAGLEEYAKL